MQHPRCFFKIDRHETPSFCVGGEPERAALDALEAGGCDVTSNLSRCAPCRDDAQAARDLMEQHILSAGELIARWFEQREST